MVMPWLFWLLLLAGLLGVGLSLTGVGARLRARRGARRPARPKDRRRGSHGRRRRAFRHGTDELAVRRVANATPMFASQAVRHRISMRRLLHVVLGACIVVGLLAASTVAGRPVKTTVRNEALASRDIVLCLDVSTSMVTTDAEILDTFSELLDTFDGERVALVVWNTTAQTIVPLTDDYELLDSELNRISDLLDFEPYYGNPALDDYSEAFSGTLLPGVEASSLIGDGLASCTLAFDHPVEDRSRSIILASDNQVQDPYGLQIYSLSEAADLAAEEDIRLFSLFGADPELVDPSVSGMDIDQARDELESVTTEHGGLFYEVDDADTAGGIVEELESEQVDELDSSTEVRVTDTPQTAVVYLSLAVLVLLVLTAWRRA